MILKEFSPHASLREFIQWYRIVHFEFTTQEEIPVKFYLPKPENILHFFLRSRWATQNGDCEEKTIQPNILFAGQRTSLVKQFTGKSFLDVQVVFQPTAIFRLTKIPANELSNRHLDATSVFDKNIKFILEELQHAASYLELISIVERYCIELAKQSKRENFPIDSVSRLMVQKAGNTSVEKLASDACLCRKQFVRKFCEHVGLNPKVYTKIIRMNRAYNLKNAYPDWDWLRIATECGYFDYQHLVKDFKVFTGDTPNGFLYKESQSPERTLGLTGDIYHQRAVLSS